MTATDVLTYRNTTKTFATTSSKSSRYTEKSRELNVCDNLADHMVGNVYVKFADEDDAKKAKAL